MQSSDWCHIFVTEREQSLGSHDVQFQFPRFTFTVTATDMSFAKRILAFIEETKGNPELRDMHLGDGVYRHMPEKSIDLSSCFAATPFVFQKLGEDDASYTVRIASEPGLRLQFEIHAEQLDAFVESLRDVVDDYAEPKKDT